METKFKNNFTTTEQSKRLLELGVPVNSADCYFGSYPGHPDWAVIRQSEFDTENDALFRLNEDITPCWSVGRLIELLVTCAIDKEHVKCIIEEITNYAAPVETYVNVITYLCKEKELDFSKLED